MVVSLKTNNRERLSVCFPDDENKILAWQPGKETKFGIAAWKEQNTFVSGRMGNIYRNL